MSKERERIIIPKEEIKEGLIYSQCHEEYDLVEDVITNSDPEDGGADHRLIIRRKSDNKFFKMSYTDWDLRYNFERDFPEDFLEVFPKTVQVVTYE